MVNFRCYINFLCFTSCKCALIMGTYTVWERYIGKSCYCPVGSKFGKIIVVRAWIAITKDIIPIYMRSLDRICKKKGKVLFKHEI